MAYVRELAKITSDTAISINDDFLPSDFQLARAGSKVRLSIALSAAVVVSLVPSSGTAIHLNAGSTIQTAVHSQEFYLDVGRTWNLNTATAGVTIRHLVIHEINEEG